MAAGMEGEAGGTGAARDPKAAKRARSSVAYHAGLAAEEAVARRYERAGLTVLARRWRGEAGEIDLIARGSGLVFVEVKASATHARAAEALRPAQVGRLLAAAEEYLAGLPGGAAPPCRFDLATVDASGRVRVLANAFGH